MGTMISSSEIDIRLIATDELESILPLVGMLNASLSQVELRKRLQQMVAQGYQCAGMYWQGRLIAIAGMWITTRFYCGKQLEPDNVIVHPDFRSQGLGQRLMAWLYDYAREQDCQVCELNAYVTNAHAHRFYHEQGFKILGFHFQRVLSEPPRPDSTQL